MGDHAKIALWSRWTCDVDSFVRRGCDSGRIRSSRRRGRHSAKRHRSRGRKRSYVQIVGLQLPRCGLRASRCREQLRRRCRLLQQRSALALRLGVARFEPGRAGQNDLWRVLWVRSRGNRMSRLFLGAPTGSGRNAILSSPSRIADCAMKPYERFPSNPISRSRAKCHAAVLCGSPVASETVRTVGV